MKNKQKLIPVNYNLMIRAINRNMTTTIREDLKNMNYLYYTTDNVDEISSYMGLNLISIKY